MNPREIELLEAGRNYVRHMDRPLGDFLRDGPGAMERLRQAVAAYDIFPAEEQRQAHEARVLGRVMEHDAGGRFLPEVIGESAEVQHVPV